MVEVGPSSPAELAEALAQASGRNEGIQLEGAGTNRRMAGPCADTGLRISTRKLNRVLLFEPRDLTISVEAGLPWKDLECVTQEHGLWAPLEPPNADHSTVGGVIASNLSGPRRRLYGTARDIVIGMSFATLEGHVAESGGMVVKNVAGLDIQKLLIGSFGTLAAIASVNFKLAPAPEATLTFAYTFPEADLAVALRDRVLRGFLQPSALEVLNPAAASLCGLSGYTVLIRAQGAEPVLARYRRELEGSEVVEGDRELSLWRAIRYFPASLLESSASSTVVRVAWSLPDLHALLATTSAPLLARAGSGAALIGFPSPDDAVAWMNAQSERPWSRIIDYCSEDDKRKLDLWPAPGPDLELMQRMKAVFDPQGLLNPGRLYGRI